MDTWVQKTLILANLPAVCPLTPPSLVSSQSHSQLDVHDMKTMTTKGNFDQQFRSKIRISIIIFFSLQILPTINLHPYLDMGGTASTR